jgi:hypothetical protein
MSNHYNPWYYTIGSTLIKKLKPCVPGDQIHIVGMTGCFNVHDVKIDHFVIVKKREERKITWDKFACKKGEGTSLETQVKRGLNDALYQIQINQIANAILSKELTSLLKDLKK